MTARFGAFLIATFALLFSAPVPAPQVPQAPDLRVQVPNAARPCPPAPPVDGALDVDPCWPYWSTRLGSASNTAELKQLRLIMNALDARISRLETKDNNNG